MKKYGADEFITMDIDSCKNVAISRYIPYALNEEGQKITFRHKGNLVGMKSKEKALDYAKSLYRVISEEEIEYTDDMEYIRRLEEIY